MSDGMSFTTRFKADTSDFSKGTSEIVKKLDEYNKALVDNQYKQKDCNKTISDARRELKNIEKEIGENKKANEDQKKRIEELNNTIEDEKLKLSKLKTEQAGLRQVISETSKELQNEKDALDSLQTSISGVKSGAKELVTETAAIGAAATASVAALFAFTKDAAQWADDINTLSKVTGISTEELQKFTYASNLIDVSVDTLTGSLTKLTRNMQTASENGTSTAAKAFEELNISVTDTSGTLRDRQTVFYEVIEALGKIENETQRDALAMNIFGRSAQELNPLVKGGAEQLKELGNEAERAGLILDKKTLNGLNDFNDKVDLLKSKGEAIKHFAASEMTPALDGLLEVGDELLDEINQMAKSGELNEIAKELGKTIKEGASVLKSIIEFVWKYKDAIGAAVVAMVAFKAAMSIANIINSLVVGFKALSAVTQSTTTSFAALNTTLNANPIGIVISGVIALTSALVTLTASNSSASDATEKLNNTTKDYLETLEDVKRNSEEIIYNANSEAEYLIQLQNEYEKLRKQTSLTTDQKERLDTVANELAKTLGITSEELKGKDGIYKDLTKDVDEYIESLKLQALIEANKNEYIASVTALNQLNDAINTNIKKTEELMDKKEKLLTDKSLQESLSPDEYGRFVSTGLTPFDDEIKKLRLELWGLYQQSHEAEEQVSAAEAKLRELGKTTDDTSDSTLSAEEATENYNKKLNEYENLLTNADDALKNTTDEQSSLKQELTDANKALDENKKLIKDETENLKKLIDEQSKCNTETEDGKNKYKDLQEKIDKSSSTLSVYIDKQKELGQNVSNVKTKIEQAAEASKTLDEKLAELSKQSNSLRSEMNSLASSVKQLEKGEALSLDTILSLIEKYPEYTDQLVSAAGNADLQKKALEALFNAKKNEYLLTQQAAIDKIKASNEETKAVVKNVEMQIRVYEMLGGIVGAVATASAIANIALLNTQISEAERQIAALEKRKAFAESLSAGSFSNNNSASYSSSSKSSENSGGKSKSTNTTHFTSSYKGEMYTADYSYQDGDYDAVKAADTAVKATLGVLDRVKNLGKLTLQEEIYNLKELLKRQGISADQRYEIKYKLYQAENKLAQDQEKKQQELEKKAEERRKAAAERQAALEKANAERREALEKAARERLEKAANELLERQQLALAAYKRLVDGRIEKLNEESQAAQENADKQIAALDAVAKKRKQTQQDEEYQKKLDAINAKLRYQQMDEFTRYELERQKQDLLNEMAEIKAERMLENQKTAITGTSDAIKNKNQLAISGLQAMNDQFADRMAYLQGSQTYDQRVANNSTTQNITVVQNGLNGDQLLAKLLKKLGA